MNVDPDDHPSGGEAGPHDIRDPEWWNALRRVVAKVIDLLESSAGRDRDFRADVLCVMRGADRGRVQAAGGSGDNPAAALGRGSVPPTALPDDGECRVSEPPVELAGSGPADPVRQAEPARRAPSSLMPRLVAPSAEAVTYQPQWMQQPFDPAVVAAGCRIKAVACRWQSERARRLDLGDDVSEGDREIVARARALGAWVWMVSPNKWRERSDDAFAVVAGCYDALADAAELMGLADARGTEQSAALRLLAEAQSMVRAAVEDYASTRRDDDQERTFTWVRRETEARQVYAEYLQLDHPAPPDSHEELRRRVASVRQVVDAARRKEQDVERTIQKMAYHVKLLGRRESTHDVEATDSDLARIAECVTRLVEDARVPVSDTRMRDVLLPLADRIPDDLDASAFRPLVRVLSAVQDYLDERAANAEVLEERVAAPSREDALLERARQIVVGREAVLIGGKPSELHRARLERGLGLRSLNWIRVEHHEPFETAETAIRRPNVSLVLLMTRWRSHRDGPAARQLCKLLAIALVELPAGYNLRQVAHRIVDQLAPQRGD